MKPSLALAGHKVNFNALLSRYKAANLRVFGSVARGDDKEGSDLDLLVDPLPGATLFDLGGLQDELQEMLGVGVDLLTPGDLPASFRDAILTEARTL